MTVQQGVELVTTENYTSPFLMIYLL